MKTVAEIFAERGGAPAPHTPESAWQSAVFLAKQAAARASALDKARASALDKARADALAKWKKRKVALSRYPSKRHRKQAKRARAQYVRLLNWTYL